VLFSAGGGLSGSQGSPPPPSDGKRDLSYPWKRKPPPFLGKFLVPAWLAARGSAGDVLRGDAVLSSRSDNRQGETGKGVVRNWSWVRGPPSERRCFTRKGPAPEGPSAQNHNRTREQGFGKKAPICFCPWCGSYWLIIIIGGGRSGTLASI